MNIFSKPLTWFALTLLVTAGFITAIILARPSTGESSSANLKQNSDSGDHASPGNHAGTQKNPLPAGILEADATKFDLGTISMAKGNVRHAYKIKNTSAKSVEL